MKILNKTIQDLKMEVETIKKSQGEMALLVEILGKKSGTIDVSISNRIQEMEERISGAEDSIENMDTIINENTKCKKILTQNIQEIQDSMKRLNSRIIGIDANEDFQLKGPVNIFNKIIEENFSNLKKEIPTNSFPKMTRCWGQPEGICDPGQSGFSASLINDVLGPS
jgi:DNA-binding FrmR family transcriptional regulator